MVHYCPQCEKIIEAGQVLRAPELETIGKGALAGAALASQFGGRKDATAGAIIGALIALALDKPSCPTCQAALRLVEFFALPQKVRLTHLRESLGQ